MARSAACSGFRRVNPAASLKLKARALRNSPRMTRFRRVNPAASLKPRHQEARCSGRWRQFPPGKSGGLIEAVTCATGVSVSSTSFRRVNPAASLKRRAVGT